MQSRSAEGAGSLSLKGFGGDSLFGNTVPMNLATYWTSHDFQISV
jgi:hypothetical protein